MQRRAYTSSLRSRLCSQAKDARLDGILEINKIKKQALEEKRNLRRARMRNHAEHTAIRDANVDMDALKAKTHKLQELTFNKKSDVIAKKAEIRHLDKAIADLTVTTISACTHTRHRSTYKRSITACESTPRFRY